jgi:hypothetical protein
MLSWYDKPLVNLDEYVQRRGLERLDRLGYGQDGIVYSTSRKSAAKAFRYEEQYRREKRVYLRLDDLGIRRIGEFSIPRLIAVNDELMVIEMGIVSPPYIVDFAGAYLDEAPPYSRRQIAESQRRNRQLFGKKWPHVRSALSTLRGHGIHFVDLNPGNVTF